MQNESMVDIAWIAKVLARNRVKLLGLAGIFYALFVAAYFKITPKYTSLTKWISLPESPSLPGLQGFGSLLGANIAASSDDFANYDDIINSTAFLGPILDRKVYLSSTGDSVVLADAIDKKSFMKKKSRSAENEIKMALRVELLAKLRSSINFVSRSPVYQIRLMTWDPGLSQSLNQRIIDRAEEYNSNERQGKSKRKRRFLGEQLEAFKVALRKSEDNLVDFQQKNIAVQNPSLLIQRERLAREVAINSQLVLEFRKQFELTRADEDNEAVQISVIEAPSFAYSRTFPTKGLFFGGGLFSSLILAGAFLLGMEFFKKFFRV